MIVVSTGCPSGVGPEISVLAAAHRARPPLLVGELPTLREAARTVGIEPARLVAYTGARPKRGEVPVLSVGPELRRSDRLPGRPSPLAGMAQLAYVDAAFDWVKSHAPKAVLVTAPVSKSVIATSGAPGARKFLGHTEWLERRDGAPFSVMCFAGPRFSTSLVTTHLPIARVARALTKEKVARSTVALAELLLESGQVRPKLAICSLNPHAGEGELLGHEEVNAISPGIELARRKLGRRAILLGPIGAETAYRKAALGHFAGVVAIYHDQATIPMKLLSFGSAVNVTWGLSIVRTSVDHGTGYDIAWKNQADPAGMNAAITLAARLERGR